MILLRTFLYIKYCLLYFAITFRKLLKLCICFSLFYLFAFYIYFFLSIFVWNSWHLYVSVCLLLSPSVCFVNVCVFILVFLSSYLPLCLSSSLSLSLAPSRSLVHLTVSLFVCLSLNELRACNCLPPSTCISLSLEVEAAWPFNFPGVILHSAHVIREAQYQVINTLYMTASSNPPTPSSPPPSSLLRRLSSPPTPS